jgi:large subunit ribosomal protein L23
MKFYKVLKKPLKTEKTSKLEIDNNTYVFIVSKDATKIDIKKSIYKMYHVEVKSINTLNTREKFKQ